MAGSCCTQPSRARLVRQCALGQWRPYPALIGSLPSQAQILFNEPESRVTVVCARGPTMQYRETKELSSASRMRFLHLWQTERCRDAVRNESLVMERTVYGELSQVRKLNDQRDLASTTSVPFFSKGSPFPQLGRPKGAEIQSVETTPSRGSGPVGDLPLCTCY